jgi:hypothetical protein
MIVTVEAVDVTNQLLTVSGPNNNWVAVKVTPEDITRMKVKDKITIRYSDKVAVAPRKINEAPQKTKWFRKRMAQVMQPHVIKLGRLTNTPPGLFKVH